MHIDVLIIGAGAAGCYCAIHAAKRDLQVVLLEKNSDIGAKIRISGGGRCNITNMYISADAYYSNNPDFCRSALARHTQWDFLDWFAHANLTWHEKTLGQLFCDQKSRGVVSALQKQLDDVKVTLVTDCMVLEVIKIEGGYKVISSQGEYTTPQLVIATGGPSFAKLGATDDALKFAKQLGHANFPFRPALVPITLSPALSNLAGISVEVLVYTEDSPVFRENLLFTHKGLSGPAILQISTYRRKNRAIFVDFLPDLPVDFLLKAKQDCPQQTILMVLKRHFAAKLAEYFVAGFDNPLQHYSDKFLQELSAQLHCYPFIYSGTEGMNKAEVSSGGLDTRQFDPRRFESKRHQGLFAIGEALDVTGWLGGYNFQWAWSSAWCCAQALQKYS